MNNQSEFNQDANIFSSKDALNQNTGDTIGSIELEASPSQLDGAFRSPLESEPIELSAVAQRVSESESELFPRSPTSYVDSDYAVFAGGKLTVKGRGDFDGDPLLAADDAKIYAAEGFEVSGSSTFPVLRDETGDAVLDADGKQQLLDNALVVTGGYKKAEAKGSQNKISGLIPPQVVETETVDIPAYRDLVVDELAQRLPAGTTQNTFNAKRNRIRNAKDWNNLFPDGGTPDNPTYVRVTEGKLEIPNKVDLSNYVIIVNKGDIQFKGSNNELDNVVFVAEDGKIETKKLQANNVSFFASDKIEIKSGSQFTGENLIANGKGKIEFKSAAVTPSETDSLTIVSAEDLELRSSSRIRGQLIARDDLRARGNSTFYGQLIAQDDLNISGRVEVYATPANEPQPEIVASIDSVTVEEGDDTTAAQLTVSLSRASETEVALDYTTSDDSASAGTDYQSVADTIIFEPGETSKAIEVAILDDNVNEPDEAFEVQLTNPNSVVLDNSTAVVDIIDNDPIPAITLANVEVDEAAGTAELTVSLANPSSREVAVDFATVDGEALAGTDYQSVADTLIFEPGETEKTITVTVFDDGIYELDEPFTLELSSPSNGEIVTGEATATIIDNEPITDIAINSVMVTEGEDSFANFEVTLSQPSAIPVTVDFTAEEGTASSGDFGSFNGSITFEPGETSKTAISIPVNDDNLDEVDEFFTVRLDNPVNAEILNDSGTATIGDNDNPPELSIADTEVAEGNEGETLASFAVSLDAPSGKEITVDYATEDDTATAGSDYTAATGTLTFEPEETTKTVDVAVSGDIDLEADEAFNLILSNPSNATLEDGASRATGTIINDDLAIPSLSLSLLEDTGIDDSDSISSNATITGSVDNLGDDVVLSASLNDGEVVEFDDEDLVQPDGSFTLTAEQLREVNGNDLDDGSYTLQLTATNPQTGDTQSQSISFVLDTTAPDLNLTAPIADGDHSSQSRLTGRLEEANLESLSYSLDDGESQVVTVDETNSFDAALGSEGLEAGEHTVEAVATDIAGNQTATSVSFEVGTSFFTPNGTTGWGAKNEDTVILGEGNSYVTQTTVPIELGLETNEDGELVGTRTISFDLDAVWGDAKPSLGEDQLQVYLMDANNPTQTILDNGIEGTPVFSIAGEQADFTPGRVNFDGTTVTIDASSLTEASTGTLVFQLLNNDEDTGSVVAVNNLTSTTDPEGFANPVFPETNRPVSAGGELNLDNLTVAPDASANIDNVRFNPTTGEYKATVSIINNGETGLSRNTAIVFDNLPDGVELIDPSGIDADGNPYLNFRPGIASGGLDVGTVSESVEVVLSNPNLIRSGLDTTILTGSANVAPVFEPIENLTVVPGQKLELDLAASDANGDNVTYRLADDSELPTGMLDGSGRLKFSPKPDEIGSYEFTIIATDGAEEVTQTVTLDVVADPVTTTRVSGVIENVEQEPLAGVPIELGELATVTAADGSFTIETDQPLTADTLIIRGEEIAGSAVYPYIAEKLPLVLGQEVFAGFNNVIDRPIYLPALDVDSGQVIDPTEDITVTTENIPGASVFVEAGSLSTQSGEAFTGTLSITEVPAELTPAALPENLIPDTVVTIQPGEMVFDTPAPLSFPNRANHPPGTEMDLWSINPETGDFDKVGKMLVSDDGSVIETIEGGIVNSSWHFPAPPPPEPQDPEDEDRNEEDECERCKHGKSINSFVESHSGALIETHELVSYQSNGEERSIGLTYDSLRADPRPIVHFGYANVRPDPQVRLTASLQFTADDFVYQVPGVTGMASELSQYGLRGGEHLWSIPEGNGDLNASIQADLSQFASGKYDYSLSTGIRRLEPIINVPNGRSPRVSGVSGLNSGDVVHVNSIESAFGSGWGIAGWQEIVENTDGSLLLIDGDGSELVFERDNDLNEVTGSTEVYASPDGDFSTLEQLADGTYRRTLKDGTVYLFNQNNDLVSVTDRNNNQTQYFYDENERLIEIVDPVGLKTFFTYNEAGKVSSIVDPANRETLLSYDAAGNLIDITDPDSFSRTWEYDSKHHMIGETDKRGNVEQTFYDFAGRVFQGVRKDGSINKVNPVQVEGLYRPETTARLTASPLASRLSEEIESSFVDANGNVEITQLDQAGQAEFTFDAEGNLPSVERNEDNLIASEMDGRGNETIYEYDTQGNVIRIEDSSISTQTSGTVSSLFSNFEVLTNNARDIVLKDLNQDLILDLVVGSLSSRKISIFLGNGNGTFSLYDEHQFSDFIVNQLEVEDLDNDGVLDIVAGSFNLNSDKLLVLLGNGDGTFTNSNIFSTTGQDRPNIGFNLKDLNNDGFIDIITHTSKYNAGNKYVSVFLGNGDGSFNYNNDYTSDLWVYNVELEDLNDDGFIDLITNNFQQTDLSVSLGNGDGTFGNSSNYDFGFYYGSFINIRDVNNDSILDLIPSNNAFTSSESLSIALGNGDGSFSTISDIIPSANVTKVEDLNDDSFLDIIATDRTKNILWVALGNGDGSFEKAAKYLPASYPVDFEIGDLNNDNILDIITSYSFANDSLNSGVSVFIGNGDGTFANAVDFKIGDYPLEIFIDDLDFDEDLDLITKSSNDGIVSINLNNINGRVKGERTFTYEPSFNQLTSATDELGRTTLYNIDPATGNNLSTTRVVDEVGGEDDLVTSYTYTDAGLVDTMTDSLGRVTNYDYDEFGRKTRETFALGTAEEASVQYEYDMAGNVTAIIDENGNRTELEHDELNRVVKVTEADPDGEGELTRPITNYVYDESGNLIETVNAKDNSTQHRYDKLNRKTRTIDSLSQETSYEYDNVGNITAINDAEGRRIENRYDSRDRLVEIIDPEGNSTNYRYDLNDNLVAIIDPLGNTTRNLYDTRDRLFRTIDAEDNVTNYEYDGTDNLIAVTDANDNRTEYEYDELNRQVKVVNALGDEFDTEYDKVGNVVTTTDELGRSTEFAYDELNRLSTSTDAEGGVAEFNYDAGGNLLSVTDEEKRTTNFEYDALDRQIVVTDPLDNPSSYTYDAVGNLTSVTDANLNTTKHSYDQLNRVDVTTNAAEDTVKTEYDAVGNIVGITDELGRVTTIAYDERDLPTAVIDALGNTTTTQYDAVGSAIAVTDARNNTTSYEYDKLRRLIKEIDATGEDANYVYDPVGNLTSFSDELDRTTTFGYDPLNRRTTVTDPLLHTTTTEYDKVSNPVSIIDANKHATAYSYDKLNRPTVITNHLGETIETEYDKVGNVTAVTDELKRTTRFEYDDRNLQTSITDPLTQTSTTEYDAVGNAISVTDPLLNKTTYNYDPLYRLTGQTDAESRTTTYSYDPVSNLLSLTDPEQNTTSYTYDDVNRLITDTNQLGHTRTFEYDEIGNRIASTDRNGREINYTFDALNRNTAETWLDENNNSIRTFNYQFDAASQLLNANDPDSAYSYDYDLDGRVTSINNAGTFGVPEVVFDYTYDPVDNLTAVNDSIDGVEAGIETFAYDELDRVTSITQSGNGVVDKRVDYSYDEASQRSDITRYSDLEGTTEVAQTSYSFDDAGRLTDLTHDSNGEVLSASQWAYDQANRITQAVTPDGISDYDYDKTDQLVDAEHSYQDDESYVYDSNGNRVNDGYVTGENNQLESDGTYNYEYDAEGNRVKRTEIATGEVTEYEWDYRNRLVAVETVDSEGDVTSNSEYTYDVFDRRIAKSVDADGDGAGEAIVERFVYDGDHIALTFDGEGNQIERFLHGLGIDKVLAQENAGGEVLWALADNQGSVRMLLDNEGNVVNEISYDAFGNITVESNPDVNFRFSYTGRELDEETGLYNYRSRYYDPTTGQFIGQDSIGFNGGDSNLYRYVFNSPLNYIDPDGRVAITGVLLLTAAVVIAADLLSPDGAHTPTMPTDSEGNRLTSEDLNNLSACDDSPIYDNPQDLDRSLQRAGIEIVLGGVPSLGKGLLKKTPQLLKQLPTLADEAARAIDNLLLPKTPGSVLVPVEGMLKKGAEQVDEVGELLLNRGREALQESATGLGAAAEDLFKPFFEVRTPKSDGTWTGERGNSGWLSNKKAVNDVTGGEPVPFKNDFPDFSKWVQAEAKINMKGNHGSDFTEADKILAKQKGWLNNKGEPIAKKAEAYRAKNELTWHHHEDATTMQLVPKNLNNKVPHSGGVSVIKNRNKSI